MLETARPYRAGEIVEGKVVGIGKSALFLDLGPQGAGIIYGKAFLEEKDYFTKVFENSQVAIYKVND